MKRITIDTRHINDIWLLPVIEKAYKDERGKTFLVAHIDDCYIRLTDGDVLAQDSEAGWHVELTTHSQQFNSRYPYTTGIGKRY